MNVRRQKNNKMKKGISRSMSLARVCPYEELHNDNGREES